MGLWVFEVLVWVGGRFFGVRLVYHMPKSSYFSLELLKLSQAVL